MKKGNISTALYDAIKANIPVDQIIGGQRIADYALGAESFGDSVSYDNVKAKASEFENDVATAISAALVDNNEFASEAYANGMKAATKIAGLAINPLKTAAKIASIGGQKADGDVTIDANGGLDPSEYGSFAAEMFDNQTISNSLYYSVNYNMQAARQDNFGKKFFPMIVMDPLQSGLTITMNIPSVVKDILRSASGKIQDFDLKPLLKNLYNSELWRAATNKVVPVRRAAGADANTEFFLAGVTSVDSSTGEDINTAPLAFDKTVDLLGISQTDSQLAKGVQDRTDALDRMLKVSKVYAKLDTDYIQLDCKFDQSSAFMAKTNGQNKDMVLNYGSTILSVKIGETKNTAGAVATTLTAIGAGYTNFVIVFDTNITGNANTATGNVSLFANRFAIAAIFNASGVKLDTSDVGYVAIAAALADIALVGFDLEAYRTNSNFRTSGLTLTKQKINQVYIVPIISGTKVQLPSSYVAGEDGDGDMLADQVMADRIRMMNDQYYTIEEYASVLNNVYVNKLPVDPVNLGVGASYVSPFFVTRNIDLSTAVDSLDSQSRFEDIKFAIGNYIRNDVYKALVESNYKAVSEALNPGKNIEVLVGTGTKLAGYLSGGVSPFNIGADYSVVVCDSPNPVMDDVMYVSFGVVSDTLNEAVNPMHFGCCAWSPSLVADIVRQNGGQVREVQSNPRYRHIINLPILIKYTITDATNVLGRIGVDTHAI